MSALITREAKTLAALVCSDPPMTNAEAARLIEAALSVAELRGEVTGMRSVNDRIDAAFRLTCRLRVA